MLLVVAYSDNLEARITSLPAENPQHHVALPAGIESFLTIGGDVGFFQRVCHANSELFWVEESALLVQHRARN